MLLYNITTLVSWPVHDSWFQWTQQQYIPQVLKTSHFFDWKMLRLLEVNDEEGPTYAIQFYANSINDYQRFLQEYHQLFSDELRKKWGDNIASFESIMEVLH